MRSLQWALTQYDHVPLRREIVLAEIPTGGR